MPRAFDLRQPKLDHSPLANLLDFSNIDQTAELAGSLIKGYLDSLLDGIVEIIEDLTGLDLSALADLFHTLDLSSPAAFIASLIQALLQVPELIPDLIDQLLQVLATLPDTLVQILDTIVETLASVTGIDLSAFLGLFTGWDLSSPAAFINSLITHLTELPETMIALIESVISGLLALPETLASLLSGLVSMIAEATGVDLEQFLPLWADLDFSNPIAFFTSLAEALLASTMLLLGPDSPLNSLNLFNLVPTDLMALLPMSNIGESLTNMITDGNFLDVASLSAIPGWIHDLTGGFGGMGAMFTSATGITKELFGNLIPVSEGQIVPISGMAKWTGLAGTGNPIQLALTGYQNGVAMVQQVIASHGAVPPTTDWLTLSGEFPVPAGIDAIRTRLVVGAGATAGTVGFSNLAATKIGAMLQRLIRGTNPGEFLPDDIGHLFTGIVSNATELLDKVGLDEFGDLINAIAGPVGSTIDAVEERIETFLDDFSPLKGGNIIGSIADEFIPGIGLINDNLVNNLVNLSGSGFTHLQVGQALRTQATAITTMSSQLTQITNQLLSLGVSIIDDFGRLSTTGLGADWLTSLLNSNGRIATPNGFAAEWIPGAGNITNQFISIFNGAISKTKTDIQNVVAVLSGQAQMLGKTALTAYNDVWTRVSAATTSLANVTGTRARFGGNGSVAIDNFINGVLTVPIASMPAGSITPPGPGAIIGIVSGFMGDLQTFGAMIGNTPVLIGNAPSNTPVGPNYLSSGMGGQATGGGGAAGMPGGTAAPAPVYQYTAMDGGAAGAPGAPG